MLLFLNRLINLMLQVILWISAIPAIPAIPDSSNWFLQPLFSLVDSYCIPVVFYPTQAKLFQIILLESIISTLRLRLVITYMIHSPFASSSSLNFHFALTTQFTFKVIKFYPQLSSKFPLTTLHCFAISPIQINSPSTSLN